MAREAKFDPKDDLSPASHHAWSLRLWRRIDRDGSGFVTRQELDCEEFRTILRKVLTPDVPGSVNMGGARYARVQMHTDQVIQFCLRKADLNSDGSISFEEFRAFTYALRKGGGELHSADMIFALFDLDSDNTINEMEFKEIYCFFLGHIPNEEDFQAEWKRLDCQGDGFVERHRFLEWMEKCENPIFRSHRPSEQQNSQSIDTLKRASHSEDVFACTSVSWAELNRSQDGWRPWHSYGHFCWSEPTKGKPSHSKMKFRDTALRTTKSNSQPATASRGGAASSSSWLETKPVWNQHLATSCPNWSDKNGKPRQIMAKRTFFSRPQSLPELRRHLDSQRGLRDHTEAMFAPEIKRKKAVLSSEHDGGAAQMLTAASRGKPAGSMRHPYSRERMKWNQHFLTPPQLKDLYSTAPMTNIGAPPRHLYVDLYDDEV